MEGIPSWRNSRHKVVGKQRTNGFGVECEWGSFPGSADLGPVETGKRSWRYIVEGGEFQFRSLKFCKQWGSHGAHPPPLHYKSCTSSLLKETTIYMKSKKKSKYVWSQGWQNQNRKMNAGWQAFGQRGVLQSRRLHLEVAVMEWRGRKEGSKGVEEDLIAQACCSFFST